jgi:PAS domain S-box-containing protein
VVNEAAVAQYGYSKDQFLSMRLDDLWPSLSNFEREALVDNPRGRMGSRHKGAGRHRRNDGTIVHAEITSQNLLFKGTPPIAMAAYDVTERSVTEAAARVAQYRLSEAPHLAQAAQERLHESELRFKELVEEQRRAQEQLKTATRLEAVGRLAGGVAHDFNNLLVAINGFAELALASVDESNPLHADLSEILKAGHRAAALTAQLLSFSRRQVLRPDFVDLNDVVGGMEAMLRRLIGEDVELVIHCEPGLPRVRIDTGHLEQVLMHLAVNARDAMPDGGRLMISTSRCCFPERELPDGLDPTAIAVLEVSDTGHGMDAATRASIFEPFFTTRPVGQGTGLGLAMVYGFVQQSGGAICVQSAPAQGATFRIALPQAPDEVTPMAPTTLSVERGIETSLVAISSSAGSLA